MPQQKQNPHSLDLSQESPELLWALPLTCTRVICHHSSTSHPFLSTFGFKLVSLWHMDPAYSSTLLCLQTQHWQHYQPQLQYCWKSLYEECKNHPLQAQRRQQQTQQLNREEHILCWLTCSQRSTCIHSFAARPATCSPNTFT